MKKSTIIAIVFLVLILAFLAIYRPNKSSSSGAEPTPVLTETPSPSPILEALVPNAIITREGVFECLPKKDPGDFQTLECAYGFRDDSGLHFVIDLSKQPVSSFDLPMDQRYSVTGRFTPIELLSTDQWRIYDVVGIITVDSYQEIKKDIQVVSPNQTVTLELLKPIIVSNTTIRVSAVLEDSRCPADAVCIQAGKVTLRLNIDSPSGSSVMTIEPGKTITTETLAITLDEVMPYPLASRKTEDSEYRFKFTIRSK